MLKDSDRANHTVGGADSVTVEAPSATRSFNPAARVAPGGDGDGDHHRSPTTDRHWTG